MLDKPEHFVSPVSASEQSSAGGWLGDSTTPQASGLSNISTASAASCRE